MEQKLFDAAAKLPETNLHFDDIENSPRIPAVKRSHRTFWTIAACLTFVLCIGFGSFAIAAEAREYQDALAFFDTYDLSTQGLTREEIKTVYRDITQATFSNPKTAEIIVNMLVKQVDGFEIPQENPSPEEVKSLWCIWNTVNYTVGFPPPAPKGIRYAYRNEYKEGQSIVFDKSYLEKYDGDTLLWSLCLGDLNIWSYHTVSDGVFVCGTQDSLIGETAQIARIDANGRLLWQRDLEHGFEDEYVASILENGDGSYAIISRGDWRCLCLSQYSADGEELSFLKTQVGNYGFGAAATLSDGYAVQLFSFLEHEHSKVVKLDRSGNITDTFVYDSDEVDYYITDMREWNGRLYLSAYATPKATDEGGRHEIAGILDYLFDNKKMWSISSDELTPIVRKNYTAMLLVCDPASGTPQTFYSVEGSLGGKLSWGEDGRLLWDVESITSTFLSPYTSSFSIGGSCTVYRYAFDGDSVSQWKTDEYTVFRK